MMKFNKEAFYGVSSECIDTKHCEPWVLAYDKHEVVKNENGCYEVIPRPEEAGKGYFKTKAYVHKNWLVIDDEQ